MSISEKELEDFIYDDLKIHEGFNLRNRGMQLPCFEFSDLNVNVKWFRQLNIDPYGICDIVGFYRYFGMIHVDIIELKIVEIIPDHFEQIARYQKGISVYLRNTFRKGTSFKINQILIGSDYSGLYIQNLYPALVGSFKYDLNGLWFKNNDPFSGWHIVDGEKKSFKNKIRSNGQAVH